MTQAEAWEWLGFGFVAGLVVFVLVILIIVAYKLWKKW